MQQRTKCWSVLAMTGLLLAACASTSDDRANLSTSSVKDAQTALERVGSLVATPADTGVEQTVGVAAPANGGTTTVKSNGVSLTEGTNGTTSAVIQTTSGEQHLTVISEASAPETYRYDIQLPAGGSVSVSADGSHAILFGSAHEVIETVDAAWAKDVNGMNVPTYFTTDGSSLTQVVEHKDSAAVYPIVADPNFHWYWNGVVITLTYDDMFNMVATGVSVAAIIAGIPGVNLFVTPVALLNATFISWAFANHKCLWFWISIDPTDLPDWGFYDC